MTKITIGRLGLGVAGAILGLASPASAAGPFDFHSVTPCRVVDTRSVSSGGPALVTGNNGPYVLKDKCGIPAEAKAVSVNVTVVTPTADGFLTLFPGGASVPPPTSTINYAAGQVRANSAIIPLGTAGDILVACGQGSGTVHMIIDVNGYYRSPAPIPVGTNPNFVAVTPDGTKAFVTNSTNPGTVTVVSLATRTVVATIPVGLYPNGIAITPDGTKALVANSIGASISVINVSTNAVTNTIPVPCGGTTLYDIAITPDSTRAVLGDLSATCTQTGLDVVTISSGAVSFVNFGGNGVFGVAVTTDGNSVLTTEGALGTSIKRMTLSNSAITPIPGTSSSFGVAVTPDGASALVASGPGETIKRISLSSNSVTGTIPFSSSQDGHNIAVTPDGLKAVVCGGFNVGVLSLANNTVLATFPSTGSNVAITPDGKTALVTETFNGLLRIVPIP